MILFLLACTPTRDPDSDDLWFETEELSDPCGGEGTPYALHVDEDGGGFVGCGNGIGLYTTDDFGDTWTQDPLSADLYVNQVVPVDDEYLVCGHDYDATDGALLFRGVPGDWRALLYYGNNADRDDSVYMANCGQVAAAGDGTLIVANDTSGDITWSTDDGASWHKEERYWEQANLSGGYSYFYMLNLRTEQGAYYGAGSKIDEPPVFYRPTDQGDFYNFEAVVVDDGIIGEVWGLGSPDGGDTWVVGGRDQGASSRASGFLYRSDDQGETWELADLGDTIDVVHEVAFDGDRGVAVGHRYPPNSLGGFVLTTTDGGRTWEELDLEVPLLQSATVVGEAWWVAGDGYLARGGF